MRGLWGVMIAGLLAVAAPPPPPCAVDVELKVVELPATPLVDMTRPLPPVPSAVVEVAELGLTAKAHAAGKVSFTLPLSAGCRERVYTFVTTTGSSQHQAVVRRIFYGPGKQGLQLFFDPHQDLYNDESFKEPPKAIVTVTVTDRRGVFPVAGATVRIKALDQAARTDEHGEADLIVPLGGPWTFEVTAPGEGRTNTFQTQVPDHGSFRFVIRLGNH